nr:hypothetical protein OG999_38090 [Streptomyces sp. NBC_00886]
MNLQNILNGRSTRTFGANSAITLDFGQDVGGVTTLSFGSASDSSQRVGLTFSESSLYVGTNRDKSSNCNGGNGALHGSATADGRGTYTVPTVQLRGGCRYLTACLDTSGRVGLSGVSLNFTSPPGRANPADCANCFSPSDDLLNRTWYAGARTVQPGTIASAQGRARPPRTSSPKATFGAAPLHGATKSCQLTT